MDVLVGQVVVVQLLAEVGPCAVHDEAPVAGVTITGQVVVVQLLAEVAVIGAHVPEGTLVFTGVQVVPVHWFADAAGEFEQVCTGTSVVSIVLHERCK